MLAQFLLCKCARTGAVKVKDLLAAFREALPPEERRTWTRSRFVAELAAQGFPIGDVHGVDTVAGLSLPIAYVVNDDGRLVKQ